MEENSLCGMSLSHVSSLLGTSPIVIQGFYNISLLQRLSLSHTVTDPGKLSMMIVYDPESVRIVDFFIRRLLGPFGQFWL